MCRKIIHFKVFLILFILILFNTQNSQSEIINFVSLVPGEGQLRDKFISTKNNIEKTWSKEIEVNLLIDGQVGTEESMVSTVRRGRAQLSLLTVAGTSVTIPEMGLLMAPYLFDTFEEADFVMDNFLKDKIVQLFDSKGLHFIQWICSGWFNIFSVKPIKAPEDIKNVRMRASGGPASRVFLQELNSDVTQLPFSDLVPSLQTGLVKGGVTNTPMYRTVGLYELAPFITLTRHGINPGTVFANKKWFSNLNYKNKEVIMNGIAPTKKVRQDVREEADEALRYSHNKGATIITLTKNQKNKWKKITEKSHNKLIEEIGGYSEELYRLIEDGKIAFKLSQKNKGQ
ncbi:MAG: TRAP transporter substrate-binding protein [Pseudomonadota bacterium]|nr:TRAP transporter substrate-binding protein [Pseudomonadota bacterium]